MSDSVRPHRLQPMRLPHPWDSPGKNTGVGCHFLLQCMKVKSESEDVHSYVAAAKSLQSCPTLCDPIDCSPRGSPVPGILQARTLRDDKPPWQGFGKAHCNTVRNALHSLHHTKVSSSSSSSNPSSWSGPAPRRAQPSKKSPDLASEKPGFYLQLCH